MKRKLMALMLAGIMVIQSAGTSWAAEFTDGVNVEYGDSSENVNEEAFSDEQTEAENFEDDSPEKDLTEEAEVPAMASGSTSDENLEVSFNNGTLTISGSGMITQTSVKNCGHSLSEIKKVIIKKGIMSIGSSAFSGCISLNSIQIPNSVTSIEYSAFYGCSSLKSIEIPKGVTSIGYHVFDGCIDLSSIEIPNSVTSIEYYAFLGCSSLNNIKIPNSVTSIEGEAFSGCSSLSSIEIPNSVTSIGPSAFSGCSSLRNIEIPNSVTGIRLGVFSGCSSLNSIAIPNSVTSIEGSAFSGCSSLSSIEIPNSVTSIESSAFSGCSSLKSIKIPSSVTSISFDTFYGCSNLKSIEISNSVTSITYSAFNGCSSLADVYYTGSKAQWKKIYFEKPYYIHADYDGDVRLLKATIHYNSIISTDKKFDLSSKSLSILGNQNSISVDFEASTPGNVANEEKAITWKSSNPAIAEIDKNATGLIDSVDGNRASGWISLLAYDVGEVTITGTTQDGRTASIEINVEPKLQTQTTIINISEKKSVTLCSVELEKENKEYLERFMKNLKVQDTGSYLAGPYVTIDKTDYRISDDGKKAELICTFTPIGNGSESSKITCTSPNGQKITVSVGKNGSHTESLTATAAFGDKSKKKTLHWTKDGYNEKK
ncbi:MAG: leucine-rich repeat protein [Ruminococcus sp.]|nr:leucine-rich repeat protein [Ruminococcus sp.]